MTSSTDKDKAGKTKAGKTGKYGAWLTEAGLIRLAGWARDGLTDQDIASNIGINRATLYSWKNKHPEIDKALKDAKDVADRIVENALYKRATGFEYDETTTVTHVVNGALSKTADITKIHKTMAGDVTAQIIWLRNRKPEKWRKGDDARTNAGDGVEDLAPLAALLRLKDDDD